MDPNAINLAGTLLTAVQNTKWTKTKREKLGVAVGQLHAELSTLVSTGKRLIRMMKRYNNGNDIDILRFMEQVEDQRVCVRRINLIFTKHGVRKALSIHAPSLVPLAVRASSKGVRLELLSRRIEDEYRRSMSMHPVEMWFPFERLTLPGNEELDSSRQELNKMEEQLEELRVFIAENFLVHEVI